MVNRNIINTTIEGDLVLMGDYCNIANCQVNGSLRLQGGNNNIVVGCYIQGQEGEIEQADILDIGSCTEDGRNKLLLETIERLKKQIEIQAKKLIVEFEND